MIRTTNRAPSNIRKEIKFKISLKDTDYLIETLRPFFSYDKNCIDGFYQVSSLYFDTYDKDSFYDKINGNEVRRKYRLRYYNADPNTFFLETKTKFGKLSKKDRNIFTSDSEILSSTLKSEESMNLYFSKLINNTNNLFLNDYFRYQLKPILWTFYKRMALVCEYNPDIRITFDYNLQARLFSNHYSQQIDTFISSPVSIGFVILEVKYDQYLPNWLEKITAYLMNKQESFSKYVEAYRFLQKSSNSI